MSGWSRLWERRGLLAGRWAGWLVVLAGGLLPACRPGVEAGPCVLLNSDFEQFDGWTTARPSGLTDERAHSGRYSLRMADHTEYGASYHTLLDRCARPPRRLRLSAWVYLPSGSIGSTSLVVEINCHGRRPNVWQGLDVEQVVKRFRKWEPVHKLLRLPTDLAPSDELKVYLWHGEASGATIWLDDLKLVSE